MTFTSTKELYLIFLKANNQFCTDTRNIIPGSLFFALKGENFNANEFAEKAIDAGCAYAIIDEKKYFTEGKTILVENVLATLQQLANFHRHQLKIPFIAITGSNGKTTTKELIKAVLSKKYKTFATHGNLNNHIGVPLSILSVSREHEIAIIEMGANHQGEIDALCKIAEPNYGIVTNIGKAHLEGFGGIEGVIKGKTELYRYLHLNKGIVIVHADDTILHDLTVDNDKITYGTKKLYDIVGKQNENAQQVEFVWKTRYTASELKNATIIKTNLVGAYNYFNLLCAAAVGITFHLEEHQINEAFTEYSPDNNRSQLHKTEKNTLILDYYNANPSSMTAAIENFAKIASNDKMLILGDMLELGVESIKEHQELILLLIRLKLENYVLVGPVFKSLEPEKSFFDSNEALTYLKSLNVNNNTILIKGSRAIKLENVMPAL